MVKLGEQVSVQGPSTRTERKIEKKRVEEQRLVAEQEFKQRQEEAKVIQQKLSSARTINEYEQQYNKLSPDMQRVFSTPDELRADQKQKIDENLRTADNQVAFYQKQKLKKQEQIKQLESEWQRQQNKSDYNRQRYERDREALFEEVKEQGYFIREWQKASVDISKGASIDDVEDFVEASVEVKTANREQRKSAKEKAKELQKKLDEGAEVLIIEKSFKGEPKKIEVSVADFEKGKFEKVGEIKARPTTQLTPSKLEVKPKLKQKVTVGGREFEFATSPQKLFIQKGELTTAYGGLGKTEAEFISEQNLELQKKGLEIREGKIQVSEEVKNIAQQELAEDQAGIKPTGQSWKDWALQLAGLGIRATRPPIRPLPFIIPAEDMKAVEKFITSDKTRAIIRTPAMLVTGLDKQLTGKTLIKFGNPLNALNPVFLYQASQEALEIKRSQMEAGKLNVQISGTQKTFEGLEEPTDAQEKRFRIDVEKYEQDPVWKDLKDKGYITSVSLGLSQIKGEYPATARVGKVLQAVGTVGPFLTPYRFFIGAELLSEGVADIQGGELLSGGLQTGIGASIFLAGPIIKGITKIRPFQRLLAFEKKVGLTGTTIGSLATKVTKSKISSVVLKSGLIVAVTGGVTYFDYKQTGDLELAVVRGVTSGAVLGGFMGYQALKRARGVGQLRIEQRKLIQRDLVKVGPKGKLSATVEAKALAKTGKLSVGTRTDVLKKGWFRTKVIYSSKDAKLLSGKSFGKTYKETLVGKLVKQGYPKNVGKVLEQYQEPFIIRKTTQFARGDFIKTLSKRQRLDFIKSTQQLDGIVRDMKIDITSRQVSVFESRPEIIKSQDFLALTKLPHGLRGLRPLSAKPILSVEVVFGKGNRFLKISGDIVKGRMQERTISFAEIEAGKSTQSSLRFLRTTKSDTFKVRQFFTKSEIGKMERFSYVDKGGVKLAEVRQDIKHEIFKGHKPFRITRDEQGMREITRILRAKKPFGVFEPSPQKLVTNEFINYEKIVPKGNYELLVRKIVGKYTGGSFVKAKVFNLHGTQRMVGGEIAEPLFKVTKISGGGGPSNKAFTGNIEAIKSQLSSKGGGQITGNVKQEIAQIVKTQQVPIQTPKVIQTPKTSVVSKVSQKIVQDVGVASKVGLASVLALQSQLQLKSLVQERMDIKTKTLQSNLQVQQQVQSQKQLQKQLQKQIQQLVQSNAMVSSSALARPIPQAKVTVTPKIDVPPFIWLFLKKQLRKKKGKKRGLLVPERAYLPDFTARALGLTPDVLSGKQAKAKIKKILTGLEIRRPVKIRA